MFFIKVGANIVICCCCWFVLVFFSVCVCACFPYFLSALWSDSLFTLISSPLPGPGGLWSSDRKTKRRSPSPSRRVARPNNKRSRAKRRSNKEGQWRGNGKRKAICFFSKWFSRSRRQFKRRTYEMEIASVFQITLHGGCVTYTGTWLLSLHCHIAAFELFLKSAQERETRRVHTGQI